MKSRKMIQRVVAMLLACSLVIGMTGCKGGNNSTDERKDAESIKQENQAVESADNQTERNEETKNEKKTSYPLTVTTYDSEGNEIKTVYEKAPSKVLAVYQGSIETMLALGLEEHMVATAGLDNEVPDEQKATFSKVKYLDEFTPSLETATMLEPDMIFSWGSLFGEKTLGSVTDWIEKGTNIYMNTNTHPKQNNKVYNKTLENEYTDILNIGKIFDVQDRAEMIVNRMKDTISEVKEKTNSIKEKPSVLVLESYDGTFTNYNASSLGGDMVTQLGGVLANQDGSSLGKEDVIAANPDVIFVVYMPYAGDDAEKVKQDKLDVILKDQAYANLDAVKNKRVVPIMLSEMYASATRTQDGIETFAKGLYPDLTFDK
ncbi:ABC transporter substrate-binding protein [Velocimicrobium porci]|uniref:ABC transporter substrate-binding protein n=1 Tax=Velocimicrobium porci TaxID=2606634 RepID=A0A6L5Y099_9FIRM|nr:ABC transporter substrate-binding protein [Velocimicrobium porci]MSS64141.1 ABC transporter substrate-binding protein [Velocimicrobium porci]